MSQSPLVMIQCNMIDESYIFKLIISKSIDFGVYNHVLSDKAPNEVYSLTIKIYNTTTLEEYREGLSEKC